MNSKLTHLAAFAFGAVIGSAAAWQIARKKYERIAEEEIQSVKETYSRREAVVIKAETEEDVPDSQARKESVVAYAARLRQEGYLPSDTEVKEEKRPMPADIPYVITPDEFGEFDEYEKISLTYYSDGVLADDNDDVVDDVEEIVGSESLTHFGEYEEDSVFVRNDQRKCDYEILLDQRTYDEVMRSKPYHRREE